MNELTVTEVRKLLSEAAPAEIQAIAPTLASDRRPGVVSALASAIRRSERHRAELARLEALARRELALGDMGMRFIAGVDEVGRGALAGPVTAGACVFPRDAAMPGLNDSKRLSPAAREKLDAQIRTLATAFAIGHAEPQEIDTLGIVRATALAMRRAIEGLGVRVDHVLVDGRPIDLGVPSTAIVRGDSSVRAIAAAAILAKVHRDALMTELDSRHCGYGFAQNKGYGSPDHLAALAALGPSPIHRMSFAPCCQDSLF
ncbi:MAG: ribonuclease HII [Coriobacteriia bacterium]|nr:ribonuclease HII [Coriobacteriia bacterium]